MERLIFTCLLDYCWWQIVQWQWGIMSTGHGNIHCTWSHMGTSLCSGSSTSHETWIYFTRNLSSSNVYLWEDLGFRSREYGWVRSQYTTLSDATFLGLRFVICEIKIVEPMTTELIWNLSSTNKLARGGLWVK